MLSDHWVIAQLIAQLCSVTLLTIGSYFSVQIIRNWDQNSSSELQITLERKSYLISSILQYVLIFQIVSLVMFLMTVNNHFPNMIKGAMCATGSLDVNDYGYPVIYVKIFGIFLYTSFLFLNYLDLSEPEYPLTPVKFWLTFPILLILAADFFLMLLYFVNIEPDVIATCCSISFSVGSNVSIYGINAGRFIDISIIGFYAFFVILIILIVFNLKQKVYVLLTGILFTFFAVYSLKYHFVKYIYGLPSHDCLFDIFWSQYYYIGYIIFGLLLLMLMSLLDSVILQNTKNKLTNSHPDLEFRLRILSSLSALLVVIILSSYWLYWNLIMLP